MAVFFTSDTHFGHAAIIDMCKRPFASVEEMNETLVARWNALVGPEDTVYHLGDVAYRNARSAGDYLKRLNGEIHLIVGNHDGSTIEHDAALFASLSLIKEFKIGGQMIVMCHYPMREWPGSWRSAWHLYGHVHGRLDAEPFGYSLDVGVDSHDFRPWRLAEIEEVLAGRSNPFANGRRRAKTVSKPTLWSSTPESP